MRGLRTLLIERSDIATGATGRNHGLLHSGARYAVNDPESAEECIKENMILRRIAAHCIDETDGLFITLPEDDLAYQQTFVDACRRAGIGAEVIDPELARRMEPSVNPDLIGAVKVPDGSVDPFRLCAANMLDAKLRGGQVRLHTEVTGFIKEGNTIKGVHTVNRQTGEKADYYAPVTVNACGIWGQHIAELAGVKVGMFPAKGALLIFAHRVNNVVINRCRKPANADILAGAGRHGLCHRHNFYPHPLRGMRPRCRHPRRSHAPYHRRRQTGTVALLYPHPPRLCRRTSAGERR